MPGVVAHDDHERAADVGRHVRRNGHPPRDAVAAERLFEPPAHGRVVVFHTVAPRATAAVFTPPRLEGDLDDAGSFGASTRLHVTPGDGGRRGTAGAIVAMVNPIAARAGPPVEERRQRRRETPLMSAAAARAERRDGRDAAALFVLLRVALVEHDAVAGLERRLGREAVPAGAGHVALRLDEDAARVVPTTLPARTPRLFGKRACTSDW